MHRFKILLFSVAVAIIACVQQSHAEASVTVDHVEGLYSGDTVWAHTPIEFTIRFTTGEWLFASTNGWRVWTHRNGAFTNSHDSVVIRSLGELEIGYDASIFVSGFSNDGFGMDTVGFSGFGGFGGFTDGIDKPVAKISTILHTSGDTLCIDSTWYPPSPAWLWSTVIIGPVVPDWGGPYCYHVIEGCCTGSHGNVNQQEGVDVSDLTMLVDYIFQLNADVPCLGAGNVDGRFSNGLPVDILDLTYLVAYLFLGGPAPPDCP